MVDRNIVDKLGMSQEKLDQQVNEMFSEDESEFLEEALKTKVDSRLPGTILKGTIVSQIGNDVIVEIGLKSEGVVDAGEFASSDEITPGKEIDVLLEDTDSESGLILLSKRKADIIKGWEMISTTKKEGDVVTGRVIRRIKGGLLVDIGVPVFLPASQVDIRKPGDISRFIGKEVECKILKIDIEGRNIVISRRKLIEEERRASKEKVLEEIEVGQLRKGVVKNIADFGVFVDLGGVDGLLHISDLSWGRISHPSEVVELDQELECIVIGFDRKNEKISLGLKQKTPSPWETVEERYPVGARVRGKVVNVMNYGVFVRLEDGVEGLVHISEMSWTRRLAHPGEMVNLGDEIEIVVLNVNKERQEISLGLKQTETNPWTIAAQKYPPGTVVDAKVRSMTNFGAFVEIEPGIDGMIHISDLSWTRKYGHPSEALQKGQQIKCIVLEVNEERHRVSLGIKQMNEDPWIRAIPEKYIPGHIIKGKIAKLTNFGAFVELEPDLEGLLHISELADHKIEKPQDVVKPGEEVEVKILKVDPDSRKIGLSLRRVKWAAEEQAAETAQRETPAEQAAPADAAVAEPAKPEGELGEGEQKAPVDQAAPADAAVAEPAKLEEELGEAEEKAATDQAAPADVDEAAKLEEEPGESEKKTPADDVTPADAGVGEAAEPEEESGEAEQAEPSEPKAQERKAGEGEASSVAKQQVTDEAEQADVKQPQDSADADSQVGGDDAEEEKAEEGA